jgi:hypothetical protein
MANVPNSKRYFYYNKNGEKKQYDVPNILNDQAIQAVKDQNTSDEYRTNTWLHIWNKSLKTYYLYTGDRETYIKDWQSNVALGLIRSSVDTYDGVLADTQLQYVWSALDERAFEPSASNPTMTTMDVGIQAVNFIADVTQLQEQLTLGMMDTVIQWFSVFKTTPDTGDLKNTTDDDITTLTMVNGEFQEKTFRSARTNLPKTTSVDPYKIYPDYSNGKYPQYICERDIVSIDRFLEMFLPVISHESNKIRGYAPILAELLRNNSQANFSDYGNIRDEIFSHANRALAKTDSIYKNNRKGNVTSNSTNLLRPNENMVEYIYAIYLDRIVLIANGYPISISENFMKILPYDIITMYKSRELITEGLPYLLFGLGDMQDSFGNNLVDNARTAAVGKMVGDKTAFDMSEEEVEELPPGGIAWTNGKNPNTALVAMPTNPVSDFGIMNMSDMYAQKLNGISEINQGVASKVRTAAEASSLVGSTNKRMNQMIQRFSLGVWKIGEKQLSLSRLLWWGDKGKWGYSRDLDGNVKDWTIKWEDLNSSYTLTLDSHGIFAANDETALTKLNDAYRTFWGDLQPEQKIELIKAIFRKMKLPVNIFMPPKATLVDKTITPEQTVLSDSIGTNGAPLPPLGETPAEGMTRAMSPQQNFGNQGEWQG